MNLISWLAGLFGASVGARVVNVASLAALAPIAVWFLANKDAEAVCFTWGQLAIVGCLVAVLAKVGHVTPQPRWWPRGGEGAQ